MKKFAQLIIKYRWIVLSLTLALTLWLGYRASLLKINADFATYLQEDSELVRSYDQIGEEFGGKSTSFLILQSQQTLSAEILTLVKELTARLEASENVSHVTSLTNVIDFKETADGLEVGKLLTKDINSMTSEDLDRFWKYVVSKKFYRGALISDDIKSTNIIIRLKAGTNEHEFSKWLKGMGEQTLAKHPDLVPIVKSYIGVAVCPRWCFP